MKSIEAAIRETEPDLVVPCDDRAVSHLHQLYQSAATAGRAPGVAALIERSLGSPLSFPEVSARHKLIRAAQEEGLLVPETASVTTPGDFEQWRARQPLPWVLKVDGTWGGHGVRVVRSQTEAMATFVSMSKPLTAAPVIKRLIANRDPFWIEPWLDRATPVISVQAHIRGYPANREIFCWRGKALAGISVEVIGALAETGAAAVVRVVDNPRMTEASERLAARLNLSGFYGFDFMIEESSRDVYLIEMNPRCTPLCHLRLGDGRDLVSALYEQLTGAKPAETRTITRSDVIAYFPQAWLWNPESEFLRVGYNDVPWEEPDLTRELLRLPWPDRSFLARVSDRLRKQSFAARSARGCTFPAACGQGFPMESETALDHSTHVCDAR